MLDLCKEASMIRADALEHPPNQNGQKIFFQANGSIDERHVPGDDRHFCGPTSAHTAHIGTQC
jgi:hypothetical protein